MRSRDISATSFNEVVKAVRRFIAFMPVFRRKKIFAFPPGMDVSLSRFRRCSNSKKDYENLKLQIEATQRLERQLPPNLNKIAAEMLEGKRPRFRKQPPHELIIVIGMAVTKASRHLPTYRNESTRPERSACDAVARAATQLRHRMTYDMVKNRYRAFLRDEFGRSYRNRRSDLLVK